MTELKCYCGQWISIDEEDLGSEDLECRYCGLLIVVPETWEEVEAENCAILADLQEQHKEWQTYRVMVEGEDGMEFCVRNGLPNDDLLDIIVDGYRCRYPEARRVFLEPEENYNMIDIERY